MVLLEDKNSITCLVLSLIQASMLHAEARGAGGSYHLMRAPMRPDWTGESELPTSETCDPHATTPSHSFPAIACANSRSVRQFGELSSTGMPDVI